MKTLAKSEDKSKEKYIKIFFFFFYHLLVLKLLDPQH